MSHNRFDLRNPAELLPLPPHDFQVLLLISDRALHGYGIVKASRDTAGKPQLELGSLYRILGRLMEMGLVEEVPIDQPETKRKRRYDCLVVWKLDRLGRSLPHLLQIVTDLQEKQVAFHSLTEQMDTTTPHGEFLFSVFGALAQYERALARERIVAGLEAAKKRGKRGGRPKAISQEKLEAVTEALKAGVTKAAVCRTFGIKRSTLYDALKIPA